MGLKIPLYDTHLALGAKIVDFGGFDMPLHYGSQIEEHHAVRRDAGVFDVSHMCVIDIHGARTRDFLRHLLANDVAKLKVPGKALYSCMLNDQAGVVDDLLVYFMSEDWFRLVVNAGTRDKDLSWIRAQASAFSLTVTERTDLAILAVQGPNARAKTLPLLPETARTAAESLPVFNGLQSGDWFIARTGYTGEDGFELVIPATEAVPVWTALLAQGVKPCGLGARDTLRLEAGMCLYGNDMDETHHPLESGLAWTVAFAPAERDFVGRRALQALQKTPTAELVGLLLEDRGVLRNHQSVATANGSGEITSGGFSPTLNRSIAFARLPADPGETVRVDVRGKLLNARVVKPPFVRNGQPLISL